MFQVSHHGTRNTPGCLYQSQLLFFEQDLNFDCSKMEEVKMEEDGPEMGLAKAEMLQRRREQQKQWQQRYRDQTKYLTSRVLPFLPALSAGKTYSETELLEKLVAAVRGAKAKLSLSGEDGGGGNRGIADAKPVESCTSGLTNASIVDHDAMISGLGKSVDPVFVLASKHGTQSPRLAFGTVRWRGEHAFTSVLAAL
jgi:hypothetical protein